MKFKRAITRLVPHLCIVFSLMTLTFFVLDRYNTVMAFMTSEQSKWVFAVLAALALISSVMLVAAQWKEDVRAARREARRRAREEQD